MPDAPRLAPGVVLAGRMRESAYVDPPWLIERIGGGYARVPELLYRVIEQCDGRQSVDEIASSVSRSTGRLLSGTDVQRLLDHRLVPSGLVVVGDASVAAAPRRSARSPLALNLRMKMVDPRRVEPITRRLLWLYDWPVVLIVLALSGLAEAWLYLVHGVGDSVRETLDAPQLLLVIWVLMLASAAFHELGHATGLSYGGGRLKGMGVGLYLVYPAFYTDVSDNYRLPRWARVRTDLGGVYFNLIFALGLFGVYAASRQEFLLLIVTLINLEMIHQLVPFVRLDGYWLLADLTGVPDFFALMAEIARARLPGGGRRRPPPRLKGWATLVFGSYVLVTVPLLALLLGLLVFRLPRIVAAAGDSVLKALRSLASARAIGNAWGMAGAALQIGVLTLPVVGLGSMLANLGRMLFGSIWRWGNPSGARRAVSTLACGAVAMLLAGVWVPQVASLVGEAPSAGEASLVGQGPPPAAVAVPPMASASGPPAGAAPPTAATEPVQSVSAAAVTRAPVAPPAAPLATSTPSATSATLATSAPSAPSAPSPLAAGAAPMPAAPAAISVDQLNRVPRPGGGLARRSSAGTHTLASPAARPGGQVPRAYPAPPRAATAGGGPPGGGPPAHRLSTDVPVARPRGGTLARQYDTPSVTRSVTGSVVARHKLPASVTRSVISASQSAAPSDPQSAMRHTTAARRPTTSHPRTAPVHARTPHHSTPAGTPTASPPAVSRASAASPVGATRTGTAGHAAGAHASASHTSATHAPATHAAISHAATTHAVATPTTARAPTSKTAVSPAPGHTPPARHP